MMRGLNKGKIDWMKNTHLIHPLADATSIMHVGPYPETMHGARTTGEILLLERKDDAGRVVSKTY